MRCRIERVDVYNVSSKKNIRTLLKALYSIADYSWLHSYSCASKKSKQKFLLLRSFHCSLFRVSFILQNLLFGCPDSELYWNIIWCSNFGKLYLIFIFLLILQYTVYSFQFGVYFVVAIFSSTSNSHTDTTISYIKHSSNFVSQFISCCFAW